MQNNTPIQTQDTSIKEDSFEDKLLKIKNLLDK
jgi:hypothetical protein